jgi:DNA-binding MarR family transcriptional regulator
MINQEHIGRLVRNIYNAVLDESHRELSAQGFPELDGSYSVVFQYIGEGARATDIAQKGKTSKQNVKYLLAVLEEKGLVQRKADQTDGRAWIFELTPQGVEYRKAGLKIIATLEAKWAKVIGKANYEQMINALNLLNYHLQKNKID